jgi:hypothetical protein
MRLNFVLRTLSLAVAVHSAIALAQSQGGFAPTGDMTTKRTGHTATVLANGKVLVVGGFAIDTDTGGWPVWASEHLYDILAGWPVWSSAELFDPLTGKFALARRMMTARAGHTATLLPDGKVLVAGGYASSEDGSRMVVHASAELYDPSTSTFTATGEMTMPRLGHTATLLNTGKVLITGGIIAVSELQSSAELYDPVTGTFTVTGSMASAKAGHVAVLLPNGRVFIEGGGSCENQPSPELYDPAIGQFIFTGQSAFGGELSAVSASLLPDGNVLATLEVLCGEASTAEVYDTSSGSFAGKFFTAFGRGYSTATLLADGSVLIAGLDPAHVRYGSAELYDAVTGAFTAVGGTFPQREEGHTATLLPDGSVLLAGGTAYFGWSLSTATIYHPAHPAPSPVLYSLGGGSQGAILHGATHEVVSPANPATQGEVLELYGSGLIDGAAIPPQVSIGGRLAEVQFFGNAPGYSGLNQINARVPAGVAPGPAVTVRLNYLGRPSNEVTIGVK